MQRVRDHPLLFFFGTTFVISWGSVAVLGVLYGMPTTARFFDENGPIALTSYLLGPAIAGLLLTGATEGTAGLRRLWKRLFTRTQARWFAVALFVAPVTISAVLLTLSLFSSAFRPELLTTHDKLGLVLMGLAVGFFGGGLFEELGWTGFAVPQLRRRHDVLTTGIIVGSIWAIWHLPPTYWGSGDASGDFSWSLFLPPILFYVCVLPAYRVLMVWLNDRSQNLFVVMLMHASLTASAMFILMPQAQDYRLSLYWIGLGALFWVIVAIVISRERPATSPGPTAPEPVRTGHKSSATRDPHHS